MDDFETTPEADVTSLALDVDGDGFAETTVMDLDGDAVVDAALYEDPYTGSVAATADTDGDGIFDTTMVDVDADGVVDMTVVDVEGDGVPEYVEVGTDPFSVDTADVVDTGSEDVSATGTDDENDDSESDETVVTDEPFVVDAADDGVHGDPMAEIEYHQAQPGPVDCVPTSIAMIASEITGESVDADTVVTMANDMGVMTASGMAPEDGARLLEELGVEAEVQSGSLDQLRTALDNDQEIVIGLDAADLYSGEGGPFDPGMTSGHAVVITGIDDNAGMVYINDPGFPDGAGVAIPIDQFEDAWADTGNTMIVATESGTDTEQAAGLGAILLPFRLVVDALT